MIIVSVVPIYFPVFFQGFFHEVFFVVLHDLLPAQLLRFVEIDSAGFNINDH